MSLEDRRIAIAAAAYADEQIALNRRWHDALRECAARLISIGSPEYYMAAGYDAKDVLTALSDMMPDLRKSVEVEEWARGKVG